MTKVICWPDAKSSDSTPLASKVCALMANGAADPLVSADLLESEEPLHPVVIDRRANTKGAITMRRLITQPRRIWRNPCKYSADAVAGLPATASHSVF